MVVEDDPAMRMYFEAALQDLVIDLTFCVDVAQALAVLAERPARLVITDLRLGLDSGLALIERLRADAATFGTPTMVVTGAALDGPGIVERSRRLGVWRLLEKPVPLDVIESCVVEALADALPEPTVPASPSSLGAAAVMPEGPSAAVLDTFFGGDLRLYTDYRDACVAQFQADVAAGDALVGAHDLPALRSLGHNLRSVLRLLGEEGAALQAERLEALPADTVSAPPTRLTWQPLRAALLNTIARG